MTPTVPMSTILPADVRADLVAASKVESRIEAGESAVRAAAVDAVVVAARFAYPKFFKKEK